MTSSTQRPVLIPHKQNGQAERTAQTVERLFVKAKEPYKVLLDYRNGPFDTGCSLAQLFPNQQLKTMLPHTSKLLQPGHGSSRNITATRSILKLKFYFKKEVSGNLLTFRDGDPVMMKFGDTWKRAEVVTPHSNPRSYVVVDMNTDYTKETEICRDKQR